MESYAGLLETLTIILFLSMPNSVIKSLCRGYPVKSQTITSLILYISVCHLQQWGDVALHHNDPEPAVLPEIKINMHP